MIGPHLRQPQVSVECLCSANLTADCLSSVSIFLYQASIQVWKIHKTSAENLIGADLYTIVILFLFGSIISLLMVRSIRPSEALDDQVGCIFVIGSLVVPLLLLVLEFFFLVDFLCAVTSVILIFEIFSLLFRKHAHTFLINEKLLLSFVIFLT